MGSFNKWLMIMLSLFCFSCAAHKTKKYGVQTQQTKIAALAKHYNAPPEVKIDTVKEIIEWETPVKFSFTAMDKENDPVRVISWEFGDGSTSRETNPEHRYVKWKGSEKQKTYKVILKTTDGNSTAVAMKTIVINRQDCIARDGQYCKYSSGVVKDTSTGLEWYVGPDRNTNWYKAKAWVEKLKVAGGGWRMPTINELKALYQKGAGTRNMTPLLKTTGWWVWSGETRDSSAAWGFLFNSGYERWFGRGYSPFRRGFAVRSRK
jgi:PKD repeat protein